MSTATETVNATVKEQAEEIVTNGVDIRPRLAEVVAQAAPESQKSGTGLVSLMRAVIDGARAGLDKAVPGERDDALRQVVDALGDGLSQTALAGKLAIEEAVGASRKYTEEDLTRLRDDLTAVRDLFMQTIERGLKTGTALTKNQISAAMTHAGRVAERMGPVFTRVLDAVRQHPATFVRESIQAGVSAGQYATGSLFQGLGRMLQLAGDELHKENRPKK